MACFPKIDQPCPLGIDAQRRIRGHCAHCSRHVQSLDGMDGAARVAYLRASTGPVCVSFRVPRAAILGLGAVLVLSSIAPAQADPSGASAAVDVAAAPAESGKDDEPVMLMGGVTNPSAAADAMEADDDLPELPVVHESAVD